MQTDTDSAIQVSLLASNFSAPEEIPCVTFRIQVNGENHDLYVRSPSLVEQPGLEAAIPLALLPAMRLRKPIHVNGPVSTSFIEGVMRVIHYYTTNFAEFSEITITADSWYQASPTSAQQKASFFSAGVDSFFTLLKGRDELTDIITIRGFDISLGDADRWEKTRASAMVVAQELGLRFHEVESNFGSLIKEFGSWVRHGHGLALACVARCLAGRFAEVRIPGSLPSDQQIPWGSSAISDPEFSDEHLAITHDACAATRSDKIVFLAQQPLALKYLRVCPGIKNDGNYNCCRCEKCLRTMVTLYACNALEHAEAFPLPLIPRLVADALVLTDVARVFTQENIHLIESRRPDDDEMLKALHVQHDRPLWLAHLLTRMQRKRRHLRRNLQKIYDSVTTGQGHRNDRAG